MRRGVLLTAVAVTLTAASGAVAAWLIYSGASGNVNGAFGTTDTQTAITFATGAAGTAVVPCTAGTGATCTGGTPGVINVTLTNNDPTNAHASGTPTVQFTGGVGSCLSHLFVTGTSGLTQTLPASGTGTGTVTFVADPSTPTSCSGGSITATLTGSTS